MICAKLTPAVSGLAQEFPGRVTGENVDARSPEGAAAAKDLGFRSHGIVIRSAGGQVLWKEPDHEVRMDDVRSQLRRLTKS
jgi:hypothetical protein